MVVFVDELDRCTPETILDVIEAIRLFLFAKGTSFVIGADQRLIEYAIRTKYRDVIGNNLDIGKEYMEKVIQYPINIPALDEMEVEHYITCLLLEKKLEKEDFNKILEYIRSIKPYEEFTYSSFEAKDKELADKCREALYLSGQISSVLAKQINGNPRQCKRFLNTLFMRLDMAKSRNIPLKQNVMAKLMLIEYFCNPFYMLVMDGKNKEDFAKFENGKFEGIFKDYSNDEWILEWNKIQCKLSKEDLRDYYYYSNSRFAYSQSVSTMLSPKARKCLENFQAKSEILRREAVKILDELSLAERKIIAKTLYDAMKTDGKLEQDIFKSYVKVIDSKDMITDALVQIKSIPAYCYTKGQITLIANLQSMSQFLSPEEKVELKTHLGEDYVKLQNITGSLKKK